MSDKINKLNESLDKVENEGMAEISEDDLDIITGGVVRPTTRAISLCPNCGKPKQLGHRCK